MSKDELTELCKAIAINVARNAGVVPEVCFPHIYLGLQDHFKAQAAIAPPVAAGSVDMMQRYETHWCWDQSVEMNEDSGGEWVKHTDAIAWGAQQREAGKSEQTAFLKECMDRGQAEFNRKWLEQKERAEKAKARVKVLRAALDKASRNLDLDMDGDEFRALDLEIHKALAQSATT